MIAGNPPNKVAWFIQTVPGAIITLSGAQKYCATLECSIHAVPATWSSDQIEREHRAYVFPILIAEDTDNNEDGSKLIARVRNTLGESAQNITYFLIVPDDDERKSQQVGAQLIRHRDVTNDTFLDTIRGLLCGALASS